MRLGFLIVVLLCVLLVAATIYVMIMQADNQQFNGYGIAAIISAIAGLIGTTAYMKKEQRRYEYHATKPDEEAQG